MKSNLAPIVLFVYNRPNHTLKTIEQLKKNKLAAQSDLFIFADGAKDYSENTKVESVKKVISEVEGFNSVKIYFSDTNKGLAASVIDGVTRVLNDYGKVIVLEDDLLTSVYFLNYMNDALNFYENTKSIWSISGYSPELSFPKNYESDVYAIPRACSWGWGTWSDRWEIIDWNINDYIEFKKSKESIKDFNRAGNDMFPMLKDQMNGHINSWAIRWCYNQYKVKSDTIYPKKSFVKNIGTQGEGTHGSLSNRYMTDVANDFNIKFNIVSVNEVILSNFRYFYNLRLINYIGRVLKKIGLYKSVKRTYKKLSNYKRIRFYNT